MSASSKPPRHPYVEHVIRALGLPPGTADSGDVLDRYASSMTIAVTENGDSVWYTVAIERIEYGRDVLAVAYFPTTRRLHVTNLGPQTKSGR